MTTNVPERLVKRIHWLGSHDPAWTREDGRATTEWAVNQALELLQRVAQLSTEQALEPSITATARGGIELIWTAESGRELDVVVPAEPSDPIEVSRLLRRADGVVEENDCEVTSVEEAAALVTWVCQ